MRKDVKVGMALALVVVILAGWYYAREGETDRAIPLAESDGPAVQITPSKPTPMQSRPIAAEGPSKVPVMAKSRPVSERARAVVAERAPRTPLPSPVEELELPAVQKSTAGAGEVVADAAGRTEDALSEPTDFAAPLAAPEHGADAALTSPWKPADWIPEVPGPGTPDPAGSQRRAEKAPADSRPSSSARTAEAVPPAPVMAAADTMERYTVQRGDSFALIAEVYYGSQRFTRYLINANPQVRDPRHLLVGTVINIPHHTSERRAEGVRSERLYTVAAGDSFFRIAERSLGAGTRWKEIYELNKDVVGGDPNNLRQGTELKLPDE